MRKSKINWRQAYTGEIKSEEPEWSEANLEGLEEEVLESVFEHTDAIGNLLLFDATCKIQESSRIKQAFWIAHYKGGRQGKFPPVPLSVIRKASAFLLWPRAWRPYWLVSI